MSRKRSREAMLDLWREFRDGARARGVDDETIRDGLHQADRLLELRLPQGALVGLRRAGLPERLAAAALPGRVPGGPAERPADGLLPARQPGARRPAARRAGAAPLHRPLGGDLHHGGRRRARSASATCARCAARRPSAWWPSARPAGPSATSPTWPRAPTCAASSSPSSCGRGRATSSSGPGGPCSGSSGCCRGPRAGAAGHPARPADPRGPGARRCPSSGRFERTITDYETTGLSTGWHLVTLVRPGLPPGVLTAAQLRETPHGTPVLRGRAGGGPPAARHGRGHRLPAARGRDRDGQLHRAARGLRAPPGGGAGRPLLMAWGRLERQRAHHQRAGEPRWSASSRRSRQPAGTLAGVEGMARVRAAAPEGQHFGRGRR